MKVRTSTFPRTLGVLAAIGLVLVLASWACAASFVVIANKDVPVNSLSKSELQAIFLGEKVKWDGIHYIKLVMPEDAEVTKSFLQSVMGKTPSQFDNHWAKLAYSGRAVMPQSFGEIAKVVDFVGKRSGAISFIPAGQPTGAAKTISIK